MPETSWFAVVDAPLLLAPLLFQSNARRRGFFAVRFVLDDISRHGAGCHSVWAGQIHQSGAAAAGKIAVLSADHHLIRTRRNSWPGVDAGAATGLYYDRANFFEN